MTNGSIDVLQNKNIRNPIKIRYLSLSPTIPNKNFKFFICLKTHLFPKQHTFIYNWQEAQNTFWFRTTTEIFSLLNLYFFVHKTCHSLRMCFVRVFLSISDPSTIKYDWFVGRKIEKFTKKHTSTHIFPRTSTPLSRWHQKFKFLNFPIYLLQHFLIFYFIETKGVGKYNFQRNENPFNKNRVTQRFITKFYFFTPFST